MTVDPTWLSALPSLFRVRSSAFEMGLVWQTGLDAWTFPMEDAADSAGWDFFIPKRAAREGWSVPVPMG